MQVEDARVLTSHSNEVPSIKHRERIARLSAGPLFTELPLSNRRDDDRARPDTQRPACRRPLDVPYAQKVRRVPSLDGHVEARLACVASVASGSRPHAHVGRDAERARLASWLPRAAQAREAIIVGPLARVAAIWAPVRVAAAADFGATLPRRAR